MKDDKAAVEKQAGQKVVSRRLCATAGPSAPTPRAGRIIRKSTTDKRPRTVRIIGGDSTGADAGPPPTIIVEKTADEIVRRIIVKCPCGREAELVCETEEPA
ncbi:MAG: hypothetical protein A3K19_19520 [Lentisphaerae bacterium RIFOXYB12_FULL_65_16]|nr:MAG: hypothetical protein A3K18_31295 [Lentisphaerae bacterium RIFOXYA12_64_32]OGV92052.1 MAG: hypothetical protein A3K19_19520 [Lentisphaerae bacterium RIFOXYB12_FULL_65_16]